MNKADIAVNGLVKSALNSFAQNCRKSVYNVPNVQLSKIGHLKFVLSKKNSQH